MKAKVLYFLIVAVLAGCGAGTMVKIPVTMPGGETATIVAHNQIAPDWMLRRGALALNYVVKGDVSQKQLAAVAAVEGSCRVYTGTVRPNTLVAVFSQGILYGAAGYVGLGLGSMVFPGTIAREYALYGASATGVAGLANGLVSTAGETYTFENCGSQVMALFPGYDVRVLQKSPY